MNSQQKNNFQFLDLFAFLKSKLFGHTLLRLFLVVLLLWVLHSIALRLYTNHGQKLIMPKYLGQELQSAIKHADSRGFKIEVSDSIFLKGQKPGIILSQIPVEHSKVKTGRTIYVTTSKFRSESFMSVQLPVLYGKKYEFKKRELQNTFDIYSKIRGQLYDPGPELHILEVYYKGEIINNADLRNEEIIIYKGDTLEFVVSTQSGGKVPVPDFYCKTLAEAKFLLAGSKLELGDLELIGEFEDQESAYVIDQDIPSDQMVALGTKIKLSISQQKPELCN